MSPKRAWLPVSLSSIVARPMLRTLFAAFLALAVAVPPVVAQEPAAPQPGAQPAPQGEGKISLVDRSDLIHPIRSPQERLTMTVNSSVILMLEKNIPRVQVNNPELLTITPLSAKQVQLHAKKTGFTKVSVWDEDNKIYTIDVSVLADTRELTDLLRQEFPSAAITVRPTAAGVVLGGFVDRA
jgi:pilus assembly protein CpaC